MNEKELQNEMKNGRFDQVLKKHNWTRKEFAEIIEKTKTLTDKEFLVEQLLTECKGIYLSQPPAISYQKPEPLLESRAPQDFRETHFKSSIRKPLTLCKQINERQFAGYAADAGCPESSDVEEILEGLTKKYYDGKFQPQVQAFQRNFKVFASKEYTDEVNRRSKEADAAKKAKEEVDRQRAIESRKDSVKNVIEILSGVDESG